MSLYFKGNPPFLAMPSHLTTPSVHNLLYLLKDQLPGHIPKLGHQLLVVKGGQHIIGRDMEDSYDFCLRLWKVNPNIFLPILTPRGLIHDHQLLWLRCPSQFILQSSPAVSAKGWTAQGHHEWSPTKLLWIQPTGFCGSLLFPGT